MNDDLCLLVTLYQHHETGDGLVRCALKMSVDPDFDREYLMENVALVHEALPMHVASIGPIVEISRVFEVFDGTTRAKENR